MSGVSAHGDAEGDSRAGDVLGGGDPERWVPGFGAKANITVTIDLEDLKRATADATGDLVYGAACQQPPFDDSPVTRRSSRWYSARSPNHSTSVAPNGWSRAQCDAR